MNADSPQKPNREIDRKLSSLRSKVRLYVLAHGLLLAIVWLCVSYWAALALDYGPVLLGFSELSRTTRLILLSAIAAVLAAILYRWVFRRVFARLNDASLALVLERRFPEFRDSLATTVESTGKSTDPAIGGDDHVEMLDNTCESAVERLDKLSVNDVFNFRPILVAGTAALLLTIGLAWFVVTKPVVFATSIQRLYFLGERQWPRQTKLAVIGFKIKRENPIEEIHNLGQVIELVDGTVTVGQASNLEFLVTAESPTDDNPDRRVPRTCEFRYWTDDGSSGTLPMNKVGGVRDGKQRFNLEGLILSGVMRDIHFYVRGADHRIGPFTIRVVPNPIITETKLQCRFPDYMVDPESMRWTARTIPWTAGSKLPYGTQFDLVASTSRPIEKVFVVDAENRLVRTIEVDNTDGDAGSISFELPIEKLEEDFQLGFVLQDASGVISDRPRHIKIEMIEDSPPTVTSRLKGIGTAVTPDAQIPIVGDVSDDYGVHRTWVLVEPPISEAFEVSCELQSDGQLSGLIDLRKIKRQSSASEIELPTTPGSQLSLVVIATDHFNLNGNRGQEGIGDRYTLDIVSADRLLRILERLEAAQRRLLEQIHAEMTDARDYLARSRDGNQNQRAGFEPGDRQNEQPQDSKTKLLESLDLRQLYTQRALLQLQKSQQEILGVAEAFDDIRLQLVNNRVDSKDRQVRLEKSVVEPLRAICQVSMMQLEQALIEQDTAFQKAARSNQPSDHADELERRVTESIAMTDGVLVQIQEVLDSLQKFETQNELLEIVRRMIADQQQLIDRTKAERNRAAFEKLLK